MLQYRIRAVSLENFMIFEKLRTDFSPGVNVISGTNSTGKTVLLKAMYSFSRALVESQKVKTPYDNVERIFSNKFIGVFRPDEHDLGHLINQKHGNDKGQVKIYYDNGNSATLFFAKQSPDKIEVGFDANASSASFPNSIYIPPKEIISSTENFGSIYREYEIAFEETYADLCYLLEKPLKKQSGSDVQEKIIRDLSKLIDGDVKQNNGKFYLDTNGKESFEMGLLSEGYRKLATLMYLLRSGSLNENTILFWDEPEGNMNPKMLLPLAQVLGELSKMGVQIFIATHSYFVQQAFDFLKRKDTGLAVNYFSLFFDDEAKVISVEKQDYVSDLEHNSIMDEFNDVYYREQELFYRD